jgi:integrase/recombinase XerD
VDWLPACSETVAAYVDSLCPALTPGTLKRRLSAIGFAHRYIDLPCPLVASSVTLAIRLATRKKAIRPAQAKDLNADLLEKILATCGDDLQDRRDAALISAGYETLRRAYESAAMKVEHLRLAEDGSCDILIPRGKADQEGQGRVAWLSLDTTSW